MFSFFIENDLIISYNQLGFKPRGAPVLTSLYQIPMKSLSLLMITGK